MCRLSSKDFTLQDCSRFLCRSRHVSLVRSSNGATYKHTLINTGFQESQSKIQSRNRCPAPTSLRCSSIRLQRRRPGTDPPILRQRRLGSRGDPLGSRFRAVWSLARGPGRIGHFKGVGGFLGQAGGYSERSRHVRRDLTYLAAQLVNCGQRPDLIQHLVATTLPARSSDSLRICRAGVMSPTPLSRHYDSCNA
jgi:hypothetical protein